MNIGWTIIDSINIILELTIAQVYFSKFLNENSKKLWRYFVFYPITFTAMLLCVCFNVLPIVQMFVTIFTTFLTAVVLFKDTFWKKALLSLLFLCFTLITETIVFVLLTKFSGENAGLPGTPRLIGMIATKLVMFWLIIYVSDILEHKINRLPAKYIFLIILTPLSSLLLECVIDSLVTNNVFEDQFIIYFILGSIIYLNIAVFDFINTYLNQVDFEVAKQMLSQEQKNYIRLQEHEKELRSIKHNLIHIISGVNSTNSMKSNNSDSMVSDLNNMISQISSVVYSGNVCIDAVLNDKFRVCSNKDIKYHTKISIDEIYIKQIDLFILLGNALDNAIEACDKMDKQRKKFINIDMRSDNDYLIIQIQNSTESKDNSNIVNFTSSKKDKINHGYGLKSIEAIVDSYDGIMKTNIEKEMFLLDIVMKNEQR